MDIILVPLLKLIVTIIDLYVWAVIGAVIISLLISFGIVNTYNQFVSTVGGFLARITEPALAPIRSFLPDLGGIDVSPIVLILGLHFVKEVIVRIFMSMGSVPILGV